MRLAAGTVRTALPGCSFERRVFSHEAFYAASAEDPATRGAGGGLPSLSFSA